jgi:hypothetical protein
MRAVTTPFRIKVDTPLAPALVGKDTCTVVLNGFDIIAQRHADKLVSFDLEVTDPTIYADGARIRFNILGSLTFDCRTAECQLWPFGLEMEDVGRRRRRKSKQADVPPAAEPPPKRGIKRHPALEKGVNWLKRQVATFTDLENVKQWVLESDENPLRRRLFRILGKQFYLRLLKWRIATPYILRVNYLIIAGDDDALQVTESDLYENTYTWDTEKEIHRQTVGTQTIEVASEMPTDAQDDEDVFHTLAFKHLSLTTQLDREFGTANPIQWGRGMHMLAWDVAVREIQPTDAGVRARLDLFYKCWSEAMNEVITITTWGAIRSAGSATLGARLALLQFGRAGPGEQQRLPGRLTWPGGGLNALEHPHASVERTLEHA